MFNVVISVPEGSIRLNKDGLTIRQGDTYMYLTAREYTWLLERYVFGEDLIIIGEGGTITLRPDIAGALTCLIAGVQRT